VLQALPAAFGVLAVGVLEAGRRGDHAIAPGRRVPVAFEVERREHAFGQLGAFLEHRGRGVGAGVLEAGQGGDLVEAGEFGHAEQHVLGGGTVSHRCFLGIEQGRRRGGITRGVFRPQTGGLR
jgi:hypothetical protein